MQTLAETQFKHQIAFQFLSLMGDMFCLKGEEKYS